MNPSRDRSLFDSIRDVCAGDEALLNMVLPISSDDSGSLPGRRDNDRRRDDHDDDRRRDDRRRFDDAVHADHGGGPAQATVRRAVSDTLAQPPPLRPFTLEHSAPTVLRTRVVVDRASLVGLVAIGQVERKYIIAADAGGHTLFAIDQHAADERVQLEDLLMTTVGGLCVRTPERSAGDGRNGFCVRRLTPPMRLPLTNGECALLNRHAQQLQAWGWQLKQEHYGTSARATTSDGGGGGGGALLLLAQPLVQSVELGHRAMLEYARLLEATAGFSLPPPPAVHRVLASKACRQAVMFGDVLDRRQCQVILSALSKCELPFQCAHGRPTATPLIELAALDKWGGGDPPLGF